MSELTGSNHRCRAQTGVGQRSAGNGPTCFPTTTTTTTTTTTNLLMYTQSCQNQEKSVHKF